MVQTKKMYLEITTLEKIDDKIVYKILHDNLGRSCIKIYSVNEMSYGDV
jgi:hypothetical protein